MTTTLPYNDYGTAMRHRLGGRIQKLAIDAHLGCPHCHDEEPRGGCSFCLGEAFSPSYCRSRASITEQIDTAIAFHQRRGRKAEYYIAYLQAGTNTYADIDTLTRLYSEAVGHRAISGLIVGTRPDCISSEIVDILDNISHSKYVAIEYGIEATDDATLRHINRGHDFAAAERAVALTRRAKRIDIGAHFILGLPYQTRKSIVAQTAKINALSLDYIKLHQLQIYRNTPIAEEWMTHRERFLLGGEHSASDYADLVVEIIRHLSPTTAIDRLIARAPRNLLLDTPFAGIDPDSFRHMVVERMRRLGATQGDMVQM